MKRLPIICCSLVAVGALLFTGCDQNSLMQEDNVPPPQSQALSKKPGARVSSGTRLIPHQYIVIYKSRWKGLVKGAQARQAMQFVNARINELGLSKKAVKARYHYASRGFAAKLTDKQLKKLKNNPHVKYIEQDRKYKAYSIGKTSAISSPDIKIDPIPSNEEIIPWGITRVNGPYSGLIGKKAWIIGTGIDLDQPDLNVDVSESISFVGQDPNDTYGHGTYVAGLLAAKNNHRGIVGVAAGATVVAVKIINNSGWYWNSNLNAALEYVESKADEGDVINLSIGGPDNEHWTPIISNTIIAGANEGLRFVISAGNDRQNAANQLPALVDHDNVYTVSAFRQGDEFSKIFDYSHCGFTSYGSNFGNPPIDYSEPGERLKSLLIGGGVGMGFGEFHTVCNASGTSYATAILSGLLLAAPYGIMTDGHVSNAVDGNPDPIAVGRPPQLPLSVSISGMPEVDPGALGLWMATVSHSDGTVHLDWYYQPVNSAEFFPTSEHSSYFTHAFSNSSPESEQAAVKVVATSAGEQAISIKQVTVGTYNCGGGPDEPPPFPHLGASDDSVITHIIAPCSIDMPSFRNLACLYHKTFSQTHSTNSFPQNTAP